MCDLRLPFDAIRRVAWANLFARVATRRRLALADKPPVAPGVPRLVATGVQGSVATSAREPASNGVPEGRIENSPALQCWDTGEKMI